MNQMTSIFLTALLVTCIFLLSTSRLTALIKMVGFQGIILSTAPFLVSGHFDDPHAWFLSSISFTVKGILIPILMIKALRGVSIRREIEPYIGYPFSIVLAVLFIGVAFYIHSITKATHFLHSPLIPGAIAMALSGLFLIVARKKAITQIAGYLVFENAIYLFGTALSIENPMIVELGVLLDVLVGVFVMGIVVYHINREFETINTHILTTEDE